MRLPFSIRLTISRLENLTCVLLLLLLRLADVSCRLWPVMASGFGDLYDRGVEQDKGLAENKQRVQEIKTLVHNLRLKLVSRRYRGPVRNGGTGGDGTGQLYRGQDTTTVCNGGIVGGLWAAEGL
jgi:hypothetical protein